MFGFPWPKIFDSWRWNVPRFVDDRYSTASE
jgi:hypothetical protein